MQQAAGLAVRHDALPQDGQKAPAAAVVHRRDIDGLRALAVLPVVAYHVGVHAVQGGFVGVDVFFVISGYLITQLLHRDIRAGRFSIITFYERRVRRIFPALLATLLAVYITGLICCLPTEMVDLSASLTAALLSVSNFYFWMTSGYFDGPSAAKPLLHTWSLAVEEQFYLFWPLLLLALHRYARHRMIGVTAALAAASLIASIIGMRYYPDANFYLPFTRIWELALGALLALGAVTVTLQAWQRDLAAGLGVILILASVLLLSSSMPFPGLLAIPPCLGTALVIQSGRDGESRVGRLLALPPVVFIGLISYSLYLWHWPINVFQSHYALFVNGWSAPATKILIVLLSIGAAALSWRFIEQPFRSGRLRPSNRQLLQIMAPASALVLVLALAAWGAGGFPSRYSARELEVASYVSYGEEAGATWREGRCFLARTGGDGFAPECLALDKERKNYLVIGDSHAAELWLGLKEIFPEIHFLQATATDCFPTAVHDFSEAFGCTRVLDEVLQGFLAREHVDDVLLVARWKPGLLSNVDATLAWFKERHIPVTLFGPTAVYDMPFPTVMMASMRKGDPALPARHLDASIKGLDAAMARTASRHGVPYVSLLELQCGIPSCAIRASEIPLIFDYEHFTQEGGKLIAQRLRDAGIRW